ncbi:hypothetical protein [Microbulbifer magnicolonia]|uniref:hypothetical protein n=1 Tax=Microbulbifer magnicolonia TaxID=3109744 RepID=UPI002B401FDC|nr:hypothetical protein [Microbulbifer sp. GG15]
MKSQDSYILLQTIGQLLSEPLEPYAPLPPEGRSEYFESRARSLAEQAELYGVSKTGLIRSYRTLVEAGLIREPELRPAGFGPWVNLTAAGEWLGYGIRYAEPTRKIGFGFGLPTGFNCKLIRSEMMPPNPPLCIAGASTVIRESDQEGILINPVDKHVISGPSLSPGAYVLLAVVDAIRIGKPRELMHARNELKKLLNNAQIIQDRLHHEFKEYRTA